jgi:hypothetical protein
MHLVDSIVLITNTLLEWLVTDSAGRWHSSHVTPKHNNRAWLTNRRIHAWMLHMSTTMLMVMSEPLASPQMELIT